LQYNSLDEWPGLKPDCSGGRRSEADSNSISWQITRCSRSLERTGRLEISQYELALLALRPGFFITGVMNASLKVPRK